MKKVFHASLALVFFALFSFEAKAQRVPRFGEDVLNIAPYSTGIGFRTGTEAGLTVKQFIGQRSALEAIISTALFSSQVTRGLNATLLWERHQQIGDIRGFLWFFGAGGHLGLYNTEGNRTIFSRDNDGFVSFGLDGIVGAEYKIPPVPITIGVDIKPSVDLRGKVTGQFLDAAFSARFVF
jgi:hypothetical protein